MVYLRLLSVFRTYQEIKMVYESGLWKPKEFNVKGFSKMHLRLNSLIMIIHLYVLVLTDNKIF